jgi:hypothetical protein
MKKRPLMYLEAKPPKLDGQLARALDSDQTYWTSSKTTLEGWYMRNRRTKQAARVRKPSSCQSDEGRLVAHALGLEADGLLRGL